VKVEEEEVREDERGRGGTLWMCTSYMAYKEEEGGRREEGGGERRREEEEGGGGGG